MRVWLDKVKLRDKYQQYSEVSQDHIARKIISENDISCDSEIILRRIQANDGRTRAYINDHPVSATLLKSVGMALVEIHGQHD